MSVAEKGWVSVDTNLELTTYTKCLNQRKSPTKNDKSHVFFHPSFHFSTLFCPIFPAFETPFILHWSVLIDHMC